MAELRHRPVRCPRPAIVGRRRRHRRGGLARGRGAGGLRAAPRQSQRALGVDSDSPRRSRSAAHPAGRLLRTPVLCPAMTSIGAGTWLTLWGSSQGSSRSARCRSAACVRSRRRARARREHQLDAERGAMAARERVLSLRSVLELLEQMRSLPSEHVAPGEDQLGPEGAVGQGVAGRRALNCRLQARLDSLGERFDAASSARKVSLSDEWQPHELDAAVAEATAELARTTRDLSRRSDVAADAARLAPRMTIRSLGDRARPFADDGISSDVRRRRASSGSHASVADCGAGCALVVGERGGAAAARVRAAPRSVPVRTTPGRSTWRRPERRPLRRPGL